MRMREKLLSKAAGRRGESLVETMVSLLIAALSLMILAVMMNASAYSIDKSRDKMGKYYELNTALSLMSSDGFSGLVQLTITKMDSSDVAINDEPLPVRYYLNSSDSSYSIISYKKDVMSGGAGN